MSPPRSRITSLSTLTAAPVIVSTRGLMLNPAPYTGRPAKRIHPSQLFCNQPIRKGPRSEELPRGPAGSYCLIWAEAAGQALMDPGGIALDQNHVSHRSA